MGKREVEGFPRRLSGKNPPVNAGDVYWSLTWEDFTEGNASSLNILVQENCMDRGASRSYSPWSQRGRHDRWLNKQVNWKIKTAYNFNVLSLIILLHCLNELKDTSMVKFANFLSWFSSGRCKTYQLGIDWILESVNCSSKSTNKDPSLSNTS